MSDHDVGWDDHTTFDNSTPVLDMITDTINNIDEKRMQEQDDRLGKEMYYQYVQTGPVQRNVSGYAIASLVTGVVGFFFFGLILGALAIYFGKKALNRINDDPEEFSGKGLAIAGIVVGIVDLSIYLLFLAITLLFMMSG